MRKAPPGKHANWRTEAVLLPVTGIALPRPDAGTLALCAGNLKLCFRPKAAGRAPGTAQFAKRQWLLGQLFARMVQAYSLPRQPETTQWQNKTTRWH
jgi:hypothetical protein